MNILTLKNVSKEYNKISVLSNVNLIVKSGEMIAVMGESGKGKTTLLNIIGLISDKSGGDITIYDYNNPRINSKESMLLRRNKIGYLFQNYGLIDDESVLWNLKLALTYKKMSKKEKNDKIDNLLNEFNILKLKNKKIYQLSGGEQQRIALIRLILQESNLILADEPTGSLDEENRNFVISVLKKLNDGGKTIIIVTHDSYVGSQCERIVNI
ncbi:putative bacteriocin export ABC transporter [Clostridium sp. UBA5119]|uniref:putative bacteriocin export ABC transporter n=1 Tax=Clostridium sp. UBA5119 TaxID=1946366 RepID=UPI003216D0E6